MSKKVNLHVYNLDTGYKFYKDVIFNYDTPNQDGSIFDLKAHAIIDKRVIDVDIYANKVYYSDNEYRLWTTDNTDPSVKEILLNNVMEHLSQDISNIEDNLKIAKEYLNNVKNELNRG